MAVSVIVCTRDRSAALSKCVASIDRAFAATAGLNAELLVIDNGSTDDTRAVLDEFRARSAIPTRVHREPRKGLSLARNAGLALARGEIIAFTDDDCELKADYFSDLASHYAKDDGPIIRGGRVELGDPADAPLTTKTSHRVEHYSPDVAPGGFVLGCNMTMSRKAAAIIGSFDARLGTGSYFQSAEDTDFIIRAHALGIPIEYVPDTAVVHWHGRSTPEAVHRLHAAYDFGNGALLAKHLVRAPWLLRHFRWTVQMALRELGGGPTFDEAARQSHWLIVRMNLLGAAAYIGVATWRAVIGGNHRIEAAASR